MTTAHRPTFDPARGKEALRGPAYHQRLLPAYTQLKFRQPGQGGESGSTTRDLRAELEAAEASHYAKLKGAPIPGEDEPQSTNNKRPLALTADGSLAEEGAEQGEEDPDAKRRRVLAETRDIDADDSDSDGGSNAGDNADDDDDDDDSDDSDDSSDDEDAELQRELERVRRERQEKREAEERARQAAEQEERERDIALGNPLLNNSNDQGRKAADFQMKRRWDDDVVFKNQARGTEEKGKRTEFINDLLRSDFHKRFMNKYVR
ncbi:Pre-mRNA-splicing factor Cwf15/Cwc15 [Dichotomopilus funicola]|uniref:Pre-mRNA-splicing factor Cwf15/Cwc15 n=1 Tax=Dichotomopilus funicola TaxID=1934379 RepID=A0AAN6V9T0_9PEZI|nr:Pre-mRNA-splicing factor Cwf15/Cwc15 [Dichotomopilus funicola]